jgi:hypothetical protein
MAVFAAECCSAANLFFTESGESPPGFNLRMETQSIPLAIMI